METTYEKFITANQSLIDCMAKFNKDQIDGMPNEQRAQICHTEASAVSTFLKNDAVSFRHLIEERIKHMHWTLDC